MFITETPINVAEFLVQKPGEVCGAVASFVGMVRNHDHGRPVSRLYYECYPSMVEKQIQSIIDEVKGRWAVEEVRVLHRIGWLEIGEAAVAIAVSSTHREEAFAACRYVIDGIKTRVPIWKKEVFKDGTSEWVFCEAQSNCHFDERSEEKSPKEISRFARNDIEDARNDIGVMK